jgi:hypothetical protein
VGRSPRNSSRALRGDSKADGTRRQRAVLLGRARGRIRLKRRVEPFVRIDRDGVCLAQRAQIVRRLRQCCREATIGTVHIELQVMVAAERRDVWQRIDGAGAHRASVSHYDEWDITPQRVRGQEPPDRLIPFSGRLASFAMIFRD